jgi:hypothetical protein
VDLPTPPLPLAMGTMFLTSGRSLSFCSDLVARTCEVMVRSTALTPGSDSPARCACSFIWSRTGQAGVVSSIAKATVPPSILRPLTKPSDTMSRRRSGSWIVASALRTVCSVIISASASRFMTLTDTSPSL